MWQNEVTAVIKTFNRPEALRKLYKSIRNYYKDIKIVIVDDGKITPDISLFDDNTKYIKADYDIGLSAGRNLALEYVKSKYFLLLDDDFMFTPCTDIEKFYHKIAQGKFDIIAGEVLNWGYKKPEFCGSLERDGDVLIRKIGKFNEEIDGLKSYDIVFNFFIAKTDRIKKISWDENLKMGEHEDFFLRAKEYGVISGLYRGIMVNHYPIRDNDYEKFRARASEYQKLFMQKHNIGEYKKETFVKTPACGRIISKFRGIIRYILSRYYNFIYARM